MVSILVKYKPTTSVETLADYTFNKEKSIMLSNNIYEKIITLNNHLM
jgi:hypothetical protein